MVLQNYIQQKACQTVRLENNLIFSGEVEEDGEDNHEGESPSVVEIGEERHGAELGESGCHKGLCAVGDEALHDA